MKKQSKKAIKQTKPRKKVSPVAPVAPVAPVDFKTDLITRLKDDTYAGFYLGAALAEGPDVFGKATENVLDARGWGIGVVTEQYLKIEMKPLKGAP